ncbi:MAG: nucleotidyltransferase family protein [Clostridia bacterium]|nr:nucleotidyltransferase family protein [Clostridia bacterium]
MKQCEEILMRLVGSEVFGTPLSMPAGTVITDELLSRIFDLARAHDVAPIVSSSLINNNLVFGSAFESAFREQVYNAVLKSEKQSFVFEKICSAFEKEKIPYIPLKGTVIKELYPEPWMRTSCDIDILIHKEDLVRASKLLCDELDFVNQKDSSYDVAFVSKENVYLELHYTLVGRRKAEQYGKILDRVWEYAEPENAGYRHKLKDEMFYFYHVAHMVKHFINGGCGIRTFVDLWLIELSKNYHTPELMSLLKDGGLLEFAEQSRNLCKVWFLQTEHNNTTRLMESYVLNGGTFGSEQTKTAVNKTKGELGFAFSRLFAPYNYLKEAYPVLKKYRFLLPVFQIVRIFSLLFGKRKKIRQKYIGDIRNMPDNKAAEIKTMFENLKL